MARSPLAWKKKSAEGARLSRHVESYRDDPEYDAGYEAFLRAQPKTTTGSKVQKRSAVRAPSDDDPWGKVLPETLNPQP